MKTTLTLLAFLITVCAAADGQVAPAATAGVGNLSYSMRYAETADFYSGGQGNYQIGVASGDLEYQNGNERLPFFMSFGGGYGFNITGVAAYGTGPYESLFLRQRIVGRDWNLTLGDNESYLPEAPTTGFTGVPGTGEPVGGTNPAPTSSQTILTVNTQVINNNATGRFEYDISHVTSLSAGGGSELLSYPDGNGLDTNTLTGNAILTQRLSARDSLLGKYEYSHYNYPSANETYGTNFGTNTLLFGYQRQWSRNLNLRAEVGPEYISGSNTGAANPVATAANPATVPNSITTAANAAINYKFGLTTANATFYRQVNGGGGYLIGGMSDSVQGGVSKEFGRNFTFALTGGYFRTDALNSLQQTDAKFGEAQASMRIGRNMIVFANYTGTDQTSNFALPTNVLNQLLQVVGFGIGYSFGEPNVTQ
jgi:hypothetical protein